MQVKALCVVPSVDNFKGISFISSVSFLHLPELYLPENVLAVSFPAHFAIAIFPPNKRNSFFLQIPHLALAL